MEQVIETYDFESEVESLIKNDKEKIKPIINDIIDEIRMRITWLVWIKDNFDVSNLLEFKDRYLKNTETIKGLSNLFINSIFNSEQIKLIWAYDVERYYSSIYWTPTDLSEESQLNLKIAEELYIINSLISDISFNELKYRCILKCKNKKQWKQ